MGGKKIVLGSIILFVVFGTLLLSRIVGNHNNQVLSQTPVIPTATPSPFLLSVPVATTPGLHTTKLYAGRHFTITLPADRWNAAVPFDCGELGAEQLALYYTDPQTIQGNLPGSIINMCVGVLDTNVTPELWYAQEERFLQQQFTTHSISNFAEETIQGKNAFVFEKTRSDFPGHFERTTLFADTHLLYRITWSIQTNTLREEQAIKQKTQQDYQQILTSFTLKPHI